MKIPKLSKSDITKLQKSVQRILGNRFTLSPYEFDRNFSGIEFTDPNTMLIGGSFCKKLLALNIPFMVGRLGDDRFHVIMYFKLKKSNNKIK